MSFSPQPITYYIQTESLAGEVGIQIEKNFTKYRVIGIWGHVTPPPSVESIQTEWHGFDVNNWVISLGYVIVPILPRPIP
jgi:hypothetical protein